MMQVITNNPESCRLALQALQEVLDPEIGLNIVDLGLIYQLDFDEKEKRLFLTMTLTTSFCPMGESITRATREILGVSFPEMQTILELTFDPPWNQGRISEEGRKFLNAN